MEELRKNLLEQARLRDEWAIVRDAANKAAVEFIDKEPNLDKRKEMFEELYAPLENGDEVDPIIEYWMRQNDYKLKAKKD